MRMASTLLLIILIVANLANDVFGQGTTYIGNQKHPDVDDRCYLYETGDFFDFGAVLTPIGICRRFTCRDDFVVMINHCGRYNRPENCEVIPTDLSQPYPNCCPKLRCTNDDGTEDIRNTAT